MPKVYRNPRMVKTSNNLGWFLLLFIAFEVVRLGSATIILKSASMSFSDLPAKFALRIDSSGVCGALHVADPLDACKPLSNDLRSNKTDSGVKFGLIVRGGCAFEEKVLNAQNAGFRAAIVYDNQAKGNLVYMMMSRENISVHAVFVSERAGDMLKEYARGKQGECCIFPFNSGAAWTVLAISFISFLIMLAILVVALFTPRQWLSSTGRSRVTKSVDVKIVEALPCFTFSLAQPNDCHAGETCAICLEDYKDGDVLKILPCRHEFHSSCVDSWLTKWGTFCPVCKHDMRPKSRCFEVRKQGQQCSCFVPLNCVLQIVTMTRHRTWLSTSTCKF